MGYSFAAIFIQAIERRSRGGLCYAPITQRDRIAHTMLRELRAFLKEFRQNYHTTGAILPSSRFLANEITSRLAERPDRPVRVLEIGPATGAFTRRILSYLGPRDQLDLCEINPTFVEHLEAWLGKLEGGPNVKIFPVSILEIQPDEPYDYIISGLPLNNFEPAMVESILEHIRTLGRSGTEFSDFEYWSIRRLKAGIATRQERDRLRRIERIIKEFTEEHGKTKSVVWRNFPPASALHFEFGEQEANEPSAIGQ